MIRFLLKVIFFLIFAFLLIYFIESGAVKRGWRFVKEKVRIGEVLEEKKEKVKEEIKERVREKIGDKKKEEVEEYPEEERKKIEEIIKKH